MMWIPRDNSILSVPLQEEEGAKSAALLLPVNPPLAIDPSWVLVEAGFEPQREREIESILTVANGYVGTRGALAERTSLSSPAVFLAGVFDANEAPGGTLDLVKLPDWTHLRVLVEGTPLSLETGSIVEHRRILDLQHGVLFRSWRHRDQEGRVTGLTFLRVASLHDRHLLLQSVTITPENYSGMISIESVMEQSAGGNTMVVQRGGRRSYDRGADAEGNDHRHGHSREAAT
jgi:trehalose/maltose hydrolase-like predicted phosphorylase